MKPFSEDGIHDSLNDPFFVTGTIGFGENPNSFAGRLRNKEQIRLAFAVDNPVKMLANSSSIYYYNVAAKQWNIPALAVNQHVGPFENYSFPTSDIDLIGGSGLTDNDLTKGSLLIEDSKGFDAYGRPVASGSLHILRQVKPTEYNIVCQSMEVLGRNDISIENAIQYMTDDYPKSIQRATAYKATNDETFMVGVDKPFLIEKAVIEIPICLGPTWFQDKTATCYGLATGTWQGSNQIGTSGYAYLDKGGPVMTVSLFCQKQYGTGSIRDLIMSGTITHSEDIARGAKIRHLGNFSVPVFVMESIGAGSATTIVTRNNGNSYTGSVSLKMTSAISNGIGVSLQGAYGIKDVPVNGFYDTSTFFDFVYNLINFQKVNLSSFNALSNNVTQVISSIDPFGRGMTGFSPSGGSIFGGEYNTYQEANTIDNPYYVQNAASASATLNDLTDALNYMVATVGGPPPKTVGAFIIGTDFPIFSSGKTSPYLINPDEKLVLAISKTRPAVSASGHNIPNAGAALIGKSQLVRQVPLTGSTAGHDVTLTTGSINITLYGSYVRQGSRYMP